MILKMFFMIITIVLIMAYTLYSKAGSKNALDVQVIIPAKGMITSSISAPGKVVSKQNSEVVSLVNSRVVKVLVDEGQLVSQGELLITLDDRESLTKVNSDKAMFSEARAKIEQAERNLKALRNVYDVGGTSLSSVQDAELQCAVAQTAMKKAAAELRSSSIFLERFKLLAPFTGIIVKKNVEIGDVAVPGVALLSLADISKTEVEVSVDESDAGSLQVGQEVDISCEALPNRIWTEKILRIESKISKDGSANILKTYVDFSNYKSVLHLGQQVDVKIKLAEKKDAYKIPFDAVIHRDGKTYFAIMHNGKVHFEPVVTGIEDATSVEILPPIPPNEGVILREGKSLHEGQSARLATRISE
jgi:RND family efflux transporter MFP subunit